MEADGEVCSEMAIFIGSPLSLPGLLRMTHRCDPFHRWKRFQRYNVFQQTPLELVRNCSTIE
jgi:hypothetical protein